MKVKQTYIDYRNHGLLKINFCLKKMMMGVDIISREIIRPSSLPIHHLKPFKLSLLDQFTPTTYVLLILFYSNSRQTSSTDHLKNSFSKTLNSFYHFPEGRKTISLLIITTREFHIMRPESIAVCLTFFNTLKWSL